MSAGGVYILNRAYRDGFIYNTLIVLLCIAIRYIPGLVVPGIDTSTASGVILLLYIWQYDELKVLPEDEVSTIGLIDRRIIAVVVGTTAVLYYLIEANLLVNGFSLGIFVVIVAEFALCVSIIIVFGGIVPRHLWKKGVLTIKHGNSIPPRQPGAPLGELFGTRSEKKGDMKSSED